MSYVTSQYCTCIGHVTIYYKRAANTLVGGVLAYCSSVHQFQLCHQRPSCGWCLTCVGCNMSSMFPGQSLLSLTVIIVLALIISTVSPVGTKSISMRPRSAALLPVSTTSAGLLCLSVGARVHHVRSNTGNCCMWLLLHMHHFQCMTILGIHGWAPTEATWLKAWA